jgi:diguanylate cyclase (GGDEF)-like protein
MDKRQSPRIFRWPLAAALCLCGALVVAADNLGPAAVTPESKPSASAFDALFRRLDIGDLIVVGTQQQKEFVRELEALVPPGDAHRRRLLDSEHCAVDYLEAIKEGLAFAEAKLAEATSADDVEAMARFHYCRGVYRESVAAPKDAINDYEKGIELSRTNEDPTLMAQGLVYRGGVNSVLGFHGKALADLLEAQRVFLQNQAPEAASQTFQNIGTAYRRLGYVDKAREYLAQSIAYEEKVGDRELLFSSTLQLGFTEEEAGNFSKALQLDQRAIDIGLSTGVKGIEAPAQIAAASVSIELRRYVEALALLDRAEASLSEIGDESAHGMIAYERGKAEAGRGQHARAIESYQRAETASDFKNNQRYLELLHAARAQSNEALGRIPAALLDYKHYLGAHEQVARQRTDQQAQMLREQFDTDRSNLENARLRAEQALKDRQVEALQRERAWQKVAMGLLAILICLLLLLTMRQLARLRTWKRMASVDALTGVANRRSVDLFGSAAWRHARAHGEPLAVLVIDLDLFKRVNDRFGHPVGDRALSRIAQACQGLLRDGDLLGRVGGEEFVVVLPRASYSHAMDVAERLRSHVEALRFDDLPEGLQTTISVGVAEIRADDGSFGDIEKRADAALYRAKTEGRNRVFGAPPASAPANVAASSAPAISTENAG